jgi:DNA-binding IclR family transcriptional regulator
MCGIYRVHSLQQGIFKLNPVDEVWQVVSDRRWHTVKEVANDVGLPNGNVASVIDFLERYGFVESVGRGRFRRTPESPRPAEIAYHLQSLGY